MRKITPEDLKKILRLARAYLSEADLRDANLKNTTLDIGYKTSVFSEEVYKPDSDWNIF